MSRHEKIHRGSGNVFADVGVSHPERILARAQVMFRIAEILKERGLTQKEASKILRIPQSKVSCLMNGKLSMFSLNQRPKWKKLLPRRSYSPPLLEVAPKQTDELSASFKI